MTDVGPSVSVPPVTSFIDDECTTAGETDGEVTCSGDEDWLASEEVVSATNWIEQSIEEEADVHHSRQNRTPWSLDRSEPSVTDIGEGRLATRKTRRERRKLMTTLRKANEVHLPEMEPSPLASSKPAS